MNGRRRSHLTQDRRVGMTLIEVLITLMIVAVLAGAMVLGLGISDRGLNAQTEANRLAAMLGVAADDVLVSRRPLALAWDPKGYAFVTQDADGRWTPDTQTRLSLRHDLPGDVSLGGDAPHLLFVGADTATSRVRLLMTGKKQAWIIAFDGLTANASPASGA